MEPPLGGGVPLVNPSAAAPVLIGGTGGKTLAAAIGRLSGGGVVLESPAVAAPASTVGTTRVAAARRPSGGGGGTVGGPYSRLSIFEGRHGREDFHGRHGTPLG